MKQENKLLQYSAMAVSFIYLNEGNAQVVYTDIEPDVELHENYNAAFIDMDDNGSMDFVLLKTSGSYSHWDGSEYDLRFAHKFWAGPYISQNEIAGSSVTHGEGYFPTYKPYALSFGSMIDENLSFQYAPSQIMAYGFYTGSTWIGYFGAWAPDVNDKYIGVRFIDETSCLHYGWIRCSTTDTLKTLIIKDFAYEEKCEAGIVAGDTIGDTTSIAIYEINSLQADVYSFNKSIFINLNEFVNEIEIHIYDLNGKMIYSDQVVNSSTQIELNEANGVYFVELIDGEKKFRKKIYLN